MKADQWKDQTKKSTLTRVSAAKKREHSVAKLKAECLLRQLVGKFYDQQQWCDVR